MSEDHKFTNTSFIAGVETTTGLFVFMKNIDSLGEVRVTTEPEQALGFHELVMLRSYMRTAKNRESSSFVKMHKIYVRRTDTLITEVT